ncbi:unnamed protein product [Lactuca saligna]|uniref:F-box domain-containing protein n=1 Tax=Lactuca saligna TaxID=75948 RepID=A0AA35YKT9_LACSI|nr:unnamed protein product [Lactuca saligna]
MVQSFVSKNDSQEKQPSENNCGLELTLAYGGFPVVPPPQDDANHSKNVGHDQSNKHEGLDLGLGTLLLHLIPPSQPVHHLAPSLDTASLINAIGRDISITCLLRCPRTTYGSIASLNRSFRELIRSGEIYKLRHDNQVIEYWVYFSCHFAKWEAFDPSTKKWMNLPIIESDHCFQYYDKESVVVGTQLLLLGKDVMGHATYTYNLLTNSWTLGKKMIEPRCLFGSASLNHIAIFAGGMNQSEEIVDTVELYDSRSGNWEMLPRMIKPRKMCSGVYMDGKFYVIGGVGGGGISLTCGEEYDFDTKKWTEIPNMSPVDANGGWSAPPLVAVVDNELYAGDWGEMELKKYEKERKEWDVIGTLPERAHSVNGWGVGFTGCGNRIIIIGGPRKDDNSVVEIYSWIPSKGMPEWSLIGHKRCSNHNFVYNWVVMGC